MLEGLLSKRQVKTARFTKISPETLAKKLNNPELFTIRELNTICIFLDANISEFMTVEEVACPRL